MSQAFVPTFFPAAASWLTARAPQLYHDRIFPAELQTRCPEAQLVLPLPGGNGGSNGGSDSTLVMRWPTLLPLAVLGALVGAWGYRALHALARRRLKAAGGRSRGGSNTDSGGSVQVPHPAWAASFFFFSCMNVSAVLCHCLLAPDGSTLPPWLPLLGAGGQWTWHRLAAALDVGFTASSCSCAIVAAVADMLGSPAAGGGGSTGGAGGGHVVLAAVLIATALSAGDVPWVNEFLYAGLAVLSVAVVGLAALVRIRRLRRRLRLQPGAAAAPGGKPAATVAVAAAGFPGCGFGAAADLPAARRWAAALFVSGLVAASGLPLDRYLCPAFGSHVNHVHVLFLGCDLIFVSLLGFLQASH